MGDERRITQVLAEVDQIQDSQRRITQLLVEADQDAASMRRLTQILLEVDYAENGEVERIPRPPAVSGTPSAHF